MCTAAHHQRALKMFWSDFSKVVHLYIQSVVDNDSSSVLLDHVDHQSYFVFQCFN